MTTTHTGRRLIELALQSWRPSVVDAVTRGERFAGAYCSHAGDMVWLHALLVDADGPRCIRTRIEPDGYGRLSYPALTPDVPAAFWYERALHDLSDVTPTGHPRLDSLLLARDTDQPAPQPGAAQVAALARHHHSQAAEHRGPVDVSGPGVFTLPLGPVRSGVYESIEFLIETTGESIPHLNIRPQYKHRGIAKRFEDHTIDDGVLVAERVEGVASVAHALAFAHACETLGDVVVPLRARLLRVVHAELERIANHLDVVARLCEAAGLAVPLARFGWHKESVMRIVSAMCGSRFGRSVVCPGGVAAPPRIEPVAVNHRLQSVSDRINADERMLMTDSTFLDRLRGTGRLDPQLAASHGTLGPVGRGSGCTDDARLRPYDGYVDLPPVSVAVEHRCDVQARLQVRFDEIAASARLVRQACSRLAGMQDQPLSVALPPLLSGYAMGWVEAPQGEVLYGLDLRDGAVSRCFARSASLHNMLLFHDVFNGDIFTDFPFIEASFGLSYAGVAM